MGDHKHAVRRPVSGTEIKRKFIGTTYGKSARRRMPKNTDSEIGISESRRYGMFNSIVCSCGYAHMPEAHAGCESKNELACAASLPGKRAQEAMELIMTIITATPGSPHHIPHKAESKWRMHPEAETMSQTP